MKRWSFDVYSSRFAAPDGEYVRHAAAQAEIDRVRVQRNLSIARGLLAVSWYSENGRYASLLHWWAVRLCDGGRSAIRLLGDLP